MYLWALLGVPLAAALFVWAVRQRQQARARFGSAALMDRLAAAASPRRRRWKAALVVLAVALAALALAGPRYGTKVREVQRSGVDLVIALDVSSSMQARDVAPNRLERAKNEIKGLLDNLQGDRVGLVLFAGDAFIQCPLTTDYNAVRLFLDVADPSLIATPGTDFEAALRQSLLAFEDSGGDAEDPPGASPSRAVLLVSDGENHIEGAETIAARVRAAGATIYAAGVGEQGGAPIPVYQDGQRIGYKRDRQGQVVRTRLEEAALRQLAQDGAYFRIARTSSALANLPPLLGRMEQAAFDTEQFEEYAEQYQWPLALALLLLFAEPLVRSRRT